MHRFQLVGFVAVAMLVGVGCGGSPGAGPESGGSGAAAGGAASGPGGAEETAAGGDDMEFQLSDSDDADQARGERPSQIESTETEAAVRLFVIDPETGPIEGVVIKMTAPDGAVYYTRETDSHGYAEVLVPIGRRYEMEYLSLGRRNTTAAVEIPEREHYDVRLTLRYRRYRGSRSPAAAQGAPRPGPERFVLEGVHFDTNSATIREESHPRLDRVVEYMTHKPSARIRIEGHTDNVGNARANQRLSEQRAEAVRQYLIEHGIDGDRIEAVGYGDTQPVASNDTEEGRAQNRRIEAIEL